MEKTLRRTIRDVPDFPRKGVVFKDITPVLRDAALFRATTAAMANGHQASGITHVVAIESRGFLLGGPIAQALGAGLIPARKAGKLPYTCHVEEYALEYGSDRLEMHADALGATDRVLIVDDVLATGGTAAATCRLVERLGATVVGCTFLIALSFLPGLTTMAARDPYALVRY
ncbi:MAG: adenine phosphoribosyltransferase [Gemmatimonadaceae bacterium]